MTRFECTQVQGETSSRIVTKASDRRDCKNNTSSFRLLAKRVRDRSKRCLPTFTPFNGNSVVNFRQFSVSRFVYGSLTGVSLTCSTAIRHSWSVRQRRMLFTSREAAGHGRIHLLDSFDVTAV